MMVEGIVIKAISSFFYVEYKNEVYECRASKKLTRNKSSIITGDIVRLDLNEKYITEILEREKELIRPKVANVSNAILIFSAIEPKISYKLLDRMILIMEINKLKTKIIITKDDLLTEEELIQLRKNLKYYQDIGYEVLFKATDFNQLSKDIQNSKHVFTGQSGVGKSTLINELLPNVNIKTQEISKALGRGKHTTREVIFYHYNDAYIIDTPGFSALYLNMTKEEVRDNYQDFTKLSRGCKYNGCYHLKEPQCAIKERLDESDLFQKRYNNYVSIINEIEERR